MTAGRGRKGDPVVDGTIASDPVPPTTPLRKRRAPVAPPTVAPPTVAPPRTLTVAVATLDPIPAWQARCIGQVAAIPGVTLRGWLSSVPTAADPGVEPTGPRATAEIPAALRDVPSI